LRNALFEQRIICGTFRIKISANYTLFEFRIPQSAFRKIHRPGLRGLCIREIDVKSQILVTEYYSILLQEYHEQITQSRPLLLQVLAIPQQPDPRSGAVEHLAPIHPILVSSYGRFERPSFQLVVNEIFRTAPNETRLPQRKIDTFAEIKAEQRND